MTGLRRDLPKRAWLRIYRVTGLITLASVALSLIFTNIIMEIFSAGLNVQGLIVSIVMPLALGGPPTYFLVLKHEQLRHANEQLEHLASTDWLTACLNRGAFTGAVSRYLDRHMSAGSGTSNCDCQSTAAPRSWASSTCAAMLAERIAIVTPDENTGSRNSAALPSSANPGPYIDLTFAA